MYIHYVYEFNWINYSKDMFTLHINVKYCALLSITIIILVNYFNRVCLNILKYIHICVCMCVNFSCKIVTNNQFSFVIFLKYRFTKNVITYICI